MRANSVHDTMSVIRDRTEINEDSECLEWQGLITTKGYGGVRLLRKMTPVHRVVWAYHNGPIPDGIHVLHKCDNRKCCNPTHLYLGTNEQNIHDKMVRDRSGKKLNIAKVKEIKKMLRDGFTQKYISDFFGVAQPTISKIALGKNWAHVAAPEAE